MAVFNGAFPILPGKEADARAFAETCSGHPDLDALQKRVHTTRETWSIQETPMGSLMLVWLESDDIEAVFVDMATADGEFEVWFRAQVLELTGVDLATPNDSPPPQIVLEWP